MNSLLKSIISSSLYLLILFVELITYKTGFISERHDAFWFISLFLAIVILTSE